MDQVMLVCFAVWLVLLVITDTEAYLCFLNSEPDPMNRTNYRWSIHERDLCGCTSLRLGTKYKSVQCTKNRWDLQQWMQCDQRIERWAPFTDCRYLYNIGIRTSGEYIIFPPSFDKGIRAFCDMDNGGWIVIQRRKDGTVDFNRTWDEYSTGFGNLSGEFWWGHNKISNFAITSTGGPPYWELSVTVAKPNHSGTAIYGVYFFAGENLMFSFAATLFREGPGEPIGNSLDDNVFFSTYDRDNDRELDIHCAKVRGAGWWYNFCSSESHTMNTNLNGVYGGTHQTGGIIWSTFDESQSLSFTEMKTRLSLD